MKITKKLILEYKKYVLEIDEDKRMLFCKFSNPTMAYSCGECIFHSLDCFTKKIILSTIVKKFPSTLLEEDKE